MFSGSLAANGTASSQAKRNDYQLKQMKDVFDKKLVKSNEEVLKKTLQLRDIQTECARLNEELLLQGSDTHSELSKARTELQGYL